MKKLTGLFVIFSLILLICICIPEFSNAQKLKPKVLDANKPGISKSVVKKPGPSNAQKSKPKAVDINKPGTSKSTVKKPRLSSSIKAKLPALEVSRLALDPGCKITGFLQNKGSKIDAGHPDFSKIEIKVWYTFNGKTEEVLLRTNSGASADQPRLLANSHDMVNFVNGRPAKFTSKLKVPSTGKGFAAVFAAIDPANKIRETSKGEQRKRIQKRLRSRCAPRLSPAVTVKMPTKKEKINTVFTSRLVKPPAGVSTPQTTGRTYQDFGIKVTHPGSDIVRNIVTIKYQFYRSSSPPDKIKITLKGFCEKISNGRDGEFGIANIYDGPPLESHRVNLSTIDFDSVGIEAICQGEVKYFFEVGEVREVGETSAGRVWGYSRHFTYLPYAFARPGSKSVKASKIKIDPNTKKKVNIPVPTTFNADNMVTKGGEASMSFSKPLSEEIFYQGALIPIEFRYSSPVHGVIFLKYLISGFDKQTGALVNHYDPIRIQNARGFSSWGGYFEINSNIIREENFSELFFVIMVSAHRSELDIVARGLCGIFHIRSGVIPGDDGGGTNPEAVSNGLQITLPGIERGFCTYADEIDFHYVCEVDDLPARSEVYFWIESVTRRGSDSIGGTRAISLSALEGDVTINLRGAGENPSPGLYKIYGIVKDFGGVPLSTISTSAIFELKDCPVITGGGGGEAYFDPAPISNGLQITSPAEGDVGFLHSRIDIRYTIDRPDIPDHSPLKFSLVRVEDINTTITHTLALMNVDIPVFIIAEADKIGRYRIKGEIFDGSNVIASGYSGAFLLGIPSYRPGDNGIEVTSPTSTDRIKVTEDTMINVNYNINNCTEALTNAVIVLTRLSGSESEFELYRGPLNASGSMSFPLPSGWLGDDDSEATFIIGVSAGQYDSTGEFQNIGGAECMTYSESFRISL